MEIILAIVVVSAVIFLGALMSIGNERQKKAIDELREQTVLWALQDLRIKRERIACHARVEDPLEWLNEVASRASGYNLKLQFLEAFDEPRALICESENESRKVLFSPLSQVELRRLKNNKKSRLTKHVNANPLLSLPPSVRVFELSVLNSGILFDLELQIAWRELTGQIDGLFDHVWMYMIS